MSVMAALLIFPIVAVLWMMLNARLGLVEDQPPMSDDLPAHQPGEPSPAPALKRCVSRASWCSGQQVRRL